jgi:hypothetical protein
MNTQVVEDDVVGGGVQVQMLAKGPEDAYLYGNQSELHPLFSTTHKRHSHMASEEKAFPFKDVNISYHSESSSMIEVPESGDAFISNMYIHIDVSRFLSSAVDVNGNKIPYYIKNNIGLRCIKRIRVYTNKHVLCDIDSDGLYILLHSFYTDTPGFKHMIGDYDIDDPALVSKIASQHVYVPVPLWFSKSHSQLFPLCLMEESLKVKVEFNKGEDLVEEKPTDDFRISIHLTEYDDEVKLDMKIEYSDGTISRTYEGEKKYLAELIVQYKIPTENELKMIKDDRTQEYVVPQIFMIEDASRQEGIVYPSLSSFHLATKLVFFVVKTGDAFLHFKALESCRIGDREIEPTELETMTPYLRGYSRVPRVYSFCPSLEPASGNPSGHVYFEKDVCRLHVEEHAEYIKTYAICHSVVRFSKGEITRVFV